MKVYDEVKGALLFVGICLTLLASVFLVALFFSKVFA